MENASRLQYIKMRRILHFASHVLGHELKKGIRGVVARWETENILRLAREYIHHEQLWGILTRRSVRFGEKVVS